jgi:hypothetical protein
MKSMIAAACVALFVVDLAVAVPLTDGAENFAGSIKKAVEDCLELALAGDCGSLVTFGHPRHRDKFYLPVPFPDGAGIADGSTYTHRRLQTIVPGCEDDTAFTDAKGSGCGDWDAVHSPGHTCAEAGTNWGYTGNELGAVTAVCPLTCDTCPSSGCEDDTAFTDAKGSGCGDWDGMRAAAWTMFLCIHV